MRREKTIECKRERMHAHLIQAGDLARGQEAVPLEVFVDGLSNGHLGGALANFRDVCARKSVRDLS